MNHSIVLAQCLISLGILVFIWSGPFARLRRDNYRSRLRNIRDGLFDFMDQRQYSFETPAYQTTRQLLNGMIRCSNSLSVLTFIHALVAAKQDEARTPPAITVEIEKLPAGDLKQTLEAAIHKAMREMVRFVFFQQISGLLTVLFFHLIYTFYAAGSWLKKKKPVGTNELVERPAGQLLEVAYEWGTPNLPSHTRLILKKQMSGVYRIFHPKHV